MEQFSAQTMAVIIWLIGFIAAAIGTLLANFIVSLGIIEMSTIISALIWFLISLTTYYAGKKLEHSWFKLISLNFFLSWIFCTAGIILGEIIWILIQSGGVSINLETVINVFFGGLPLAIGPTLSLSLGLRD